MKALIKALKQVTRQDMVKDGKVAKMPVISISAQEGRMPKTIHCSRCNFSITFIAPAKPDAIRWYRHHQQRHITGRAYHLADITHIKSAFRQPSYEAV